MNKDHSQKRTARENFADFVRRIMNERDLSYRAVSRLSGGKVNPSTVNKIVNGRQKDIGVETMMALAKGLGIPERQLIAALRGEAVENSEFDEIEALFFRFKQLTPQKRQELSMLVQMFDREIDARRD